MKGIDYLAMSVKVKYHLNMFGLARAAWVLGLINDDKSEEKLGKHFMAAYNTMHKYDPDLAMEGLERIRKAIHNEK